MQWNLHWYDFIIIYAISFSPFIVLAILVALLLRDVMRKKLSRSSAVLAIIVCALFVLLRLLSSVI